MKLLFIDDQRDTLQPAIQAVEDTGAHTCFICDFQDAVEQIKSRQPDIIVLDLMEGMGEPAAQHEAWREPYDFIWSQRFCPIIVFSAFADELSVDRPDVSHPFITTVVKGQTGPSDLLAALEQFSSHVEVLQRTEADTQRMLRTAMRAVAPHVFRCLPDDPDARVDVTQRMTKRRLAASLDESLEGIQPWAWEQFICPPLDSEGLLTGDILLRSGKDEANPESYMIVLTPSCDLVGGQQGLKAENVLLAQCVCIREAVKELNNGDLPAMPNSKLRRKIEDALAIGFFRHFVFVPGLLRSVPVMATNLKKLVVLPVAEVVGIDKTLIRVASVDSPFRELITWAYLQSVGRPGVPDRNRTHWQREIIQSIYPQGQGQDAGN